MALSNWDVLAFDSDGNSCNGELVVPSGKVVIHKNWVSVRCSDDKYLASIQHGKVRIACIDIVAVRHPDQDSVFVFAECTDHCMAGIGCYGFLDDLECLKKLYPEEYNRIPQQYLDADKYSHSTFVTRGEWGFTFDGDNDYYQVTINAKRFDLSDMWAGVSLQTFVAFLEWLKEVAPQEYFQKIKLAHRFNQGDAYFAKHLGIELPRTEIGKSTAPILSQMLESWQEDEST